MSSRGSLNRQEMLPAGTSTTATGIAWPTNDQVASASVLSTAGVTAVVMLEGSNNGGASWEAIAQFTLPNPDTNAPDVKAARATIECPSELKRMRVVSIAGGSVSGLLVW